LKERRRKGTQHPTYKEHETDVNSGTKNGRHRRIGAEKKSRKEEKKATNEKKEKRKKGEERTVTEGISAPADPAPVIEAA
jgi:hypothetical protein